MKNIFLDNIYKKNNSSFNFIAVGHPRRRGAGHPDQGDHRRRRRHSAHPQVAHRQERGGKPAPVLEHAQLCTESTTPF